MSDEQFDEMVEEVTEAIMPSLSVVVDFNDLLQCHDEAEVWRLIATLKDVLA